MFGDATENKKLKKSRPNRTSRTKESFSRASCPARAPWSDFCSGRIAAEEGGGGCCAHWCQAGRAKRANCGRIIAIARGREEIEVKRGCIFRRGRVVSFVPATLVGISSIFYTVGTVVIATYALICLLLSLTENLLLVLCTGRPIMSGLITFRLSSARRGVLSMRG